MAALNLRIEHRTLTLSKLHGLVRRARSRRFLNALRKS